jgi:hypothetical protein
MSICVNFEFLGGDGFSIYFEECHHLVLLDMCLIGFGACFVTQVLLNLRFAPEKQLHQCNVEQWPNAKTKGVFLFDQTIFEHYW